MRRCRGGEERKGVVVEGVRIVFGGLAPVQVVFI